MFITSVGTVNVNRSYTYWNVEGPSAQHTVTEKLMERNICSEIDFGWMGKQKAIFLDQNLNPAVNFVSSDIWWSFPTANEIWGVLKAGSGSEFCSLSLLSSSKGYAVTYWSGS